MHAVYGSESLVETFYAPYEADTRASNPSRIELLFGPDNPAGKGLWKHPNLHRLRRITHGISYQQMTSNIIPRGRFRGSHHLHRFFTILTAITWIHTLTGVDARDKDYMMITDGDSQQLDFVTLYNNSRLSSNLKNQTSNEDKRLLISGVGTLSAEEIRNLVNAIKTLVPLETTQDTAIRSMILRMLTHSDCPTLMEEDIFGLLADSDKSSLHRQFFTPS